MQSSPQLLQRRQFLAALAIASSTAACRTTSSPAKAKGLVGTQLYGWGQYYQRDRKKITEHYPEVLSAVRDCGYDYVETSLGITQPDQAARFAELAKGKGLQVTCFYTGARLHEPRSAEEVIPKIVAAAKAVKPFGTRIINCNPDPIGREKTDAELRTQAENLSQLGRQLNALGIKLGVHNHTPEMKNKAREFHSNFRHTPANAVGFCFDVHWVWRGGVMPLDALTLYGERIVSWHLRQSRDGIWWEDLDAGDIDYSPISWQAEDMKLPRVFTVELALEPGTKITRSVVENHRRSRAWVRQTFGV